MNESDHDHHDSFEQTTVEHFLQNSRAVDNEIDLIFLTCHRLSSKFYYFYSSYLQKKALKMCTI